MQNQVKKLLHLQLPLNFSNPFTNTGKKKEPSLASREVYYNNALRGVGQARQEAINRQYERYLLK